MIYNTSRRHPKSTTLVPDVSFHRDNKEGYMDALCAALALFIGNIAIIVPLFIWNRAESRSDIRHMDNKLEVYVQGIREDVKAIHSEMKDFHGRLERQDAEFKGKLALQDAEFKAHIIHFHEKKC